MSDTLEYPFNKAVATGDIVTEQYVIVRSPVYGPPEDPDSIGGGYNGYVIFQERPTIESGYDGILVYVPVHGGITYAEELSDGRMVYGFDTNHYDSKDYPIQDMDWIKNQCILMRDAVLAAAKVELEYILAESLPVEQSNEVREKLVQPIVDMVSSGSVNFLTALRFLSGRL